MEMQIHLKTIDSLTIKIFPKNVAFYNRFIEKFIKKNFNTSISGRKSVNLIGKTFDCYYYRSHKSGYALRLKEYGECNLNFTVSYPKELSPIEVKIIQPAIWVDGLAKAEDILEKLKNILGEVDHKIDQVDIAVFFSGWQIVIEEYDLIKTYTDNIYCYRKNGHIDTWYVGTASLEIPQVKSYNKGAYIKKNPHLPSPIHLFKQKPFMDRDFWNIEITFNSNVLKTFNVKTIPELQEAIPYLWEYATKEFMIISHSKKYENSIPQWVKISDAITVKDKNKFKRSPKKKQDPNINFRKEQMLRAVRSYQKICTDPPEETLELLRKYIV